MWSKTMSSSNCIKSKVVFACLVVFIFSSCSLSRAQLKTTDLYDICKSRYSIDNGLISPYDSKDKENIDGELKERAKDCGCYYQAWSPAYLNMGLLGMGLMSSSAGHCENDNPTEAKENTPTQKSE